jgi:DNA-binding response OmpR family regulator
MIVDDEPDILPYLESHEAAEHVHDEKFDGIITDVQMPHLDGFELAKRIRSSALNRTTPIIMLTGHDDVDTMRQGFRVGATCFLGKPIDRDRFSALLKAMRGSMLAERRRYARLPYRTRVKCKPGPHFDQQFVASTLTISEGGLSLEPSGGLENGQELEMEFQMTGLPMPLKIRGRVVRQEPSEPIGIEFIGPSQKDREAIRRYVEEGVKL